MFSNKHHTKGQALIEFALISVVLLMLLFVIIESSRILWAWITVQAAAREGARYAITGRFDPDFLGAPDPRLESIKFTTRGALAGLQLNEDPNAAFEDDYFYTIEVWGVNDMNVLQPDFPGLPGRPVVVRVTYRVPIITPLLRPIMNSIPVFGQVVINNELFGQQGNASQGVGVPPALPAVPTPGPTPSPTPSPTPTDTPTIGPTPDDTPTFTPTYTPTPVRCNTQFEGNLVAETSLASVTGDVNTQIEIINLSTGQTIGAATIIGPFDGHACPGFVVVSPLTTVLVADDVILVNNLTDGSFDTAIVLEGTATPTPSPTASASPTVAPTNTPTVTPTGTPSTPYIVLNPECGSGPGVQFVVRGFNWPTNRQVSLYFDNQLQTVVPIGHPGSFVYTWTFTNVGTGVHTVLAIAPGGISNSKTFTVPCPNITPTVTPTSTPGPADLIIVGNPALVSTPPIVAYRPVDFSVEIQNIGSVDVNSQFFVDVYFDPAVVLTYTIPISYSAGYAAVTSLAGGQTRVLNITAPNGFTGPANTHEVYAMVDSVQQAVESDEGNNIAGPIVVQVTPAASPTPSPTPIGGGSSISGKAYARISVWLPQYRAMVRLYQGAVLVSATQSDLTGFFEFPNVADATYSVIGCINIDGNSYFGQRTGLTVPPSNPYAHVWMTPGVCP